MTRDEAKGVLFDMLGKGIYVKNTKENQAILAALRALEQKPCEDWYDVPSDEMTLEQARQAVKELRKMWAEHLPSVSTRKAGWIPVSERLPENESRVLVTIQTPMRSKVRSGMFDNERFYNDNGDTWKVTDKEVKAWMPLPEPYRAESKIKQASAYADQDTLMPAT